MEREFHGEIKQILKRYPLLREIFLCGIIGCSTACLDSGIFLVLRKFHINLYLSNFVGNNVGITVSFLLNTFLNFKVKDCITQRMLRFFAVGYCGLLLSMFLMYVGINILFLKEITVKLISIIIVAVFQFILNKSFTYRRSHSHG